MEKKEYKKPEIVMDWGKFQMELALIKMQQNSPLYRVTLDNLKEEDIEFFWRLRSGRIKRKDYKKHLKNVSKKYGDESDSAHFAADYLSAKVTTFFMRKDIVSAKKKP